MKWDFDGIRRERKSERDFPLFFFHFFWGRSCFTTHAQKRGEK